MNHTPGPWKYVEGNGIASDLLGSTKMWMPIIFPEQGMDVAYVVVPGDGRERANARLIAAAPELMEACKLALGAFERNNAIDWNILEKAIAKAEGKATV